MSASIRPSASVFRTSSPAASASASRSHARSCSSRRILLLDEPTSALDVSIQAEVLNLLQALRQERKLTYILVSHDLAVVAHMCERLAGHAVDAGRPLVLESHVQIPGKLCL
jgi:ABC-type methionine transport system ATPase subunit